MPLIVSDAGPLIALSRIGHLSLLQSLFVEVVVPTTVLNELRLAERRPGVEPLAEAVHSQGWIRSMALPEFQAIPGLGEGEASAIQLAEHLACPLLIDERRGRIAARKHGLEVIGTGRVLLAAKEQRLIETIDELLEALKDSGYRLSDGLCRRLLELAGERS
jgi:predicted nucleic acid-binding protein